jgi:hypothetical protein
VFIFADSILRAAVAQRPVAKFKNGKVFLRRVLPRFRQRIA